MRCESDISTLLELNKYNGLKEKIKGEQYRNLFISGDHKVLTAAVRQKIMKVREIFSREK